MFAALAGLLYLVNPFAAVLLLPAGSVPSVASDLGARGQPLAWLFNGADVLSGFFNLVSCGLLLRFGTRAGPSLWGVVSIAALMVEAVSAIAAALVPLPAHGPEVVHTELYYIDGLGFLFSVWLLAIHKNGVPRRCLVIAACAVTLTGVLCMFLQDPRAFEIAQRLLILQTALWIATFPWLRPTE